jgi:hypothetical protein
VRDLITLRALTIAPDAEVTEPAQKMLISATDIVRAVDSGRL